MAGAAYQATFVISTLVSLPFVTRALSPDAFGVLAALTAAPVILAFTDLGIGSALMSRLAKTRARGDHEAARRAVGTALAAALGAGVLVAMVGVVAALTLPWRSILGAGDLSKGDVTAAVLAAALVTGFSVPAALGQRILYGVHRGGAANRWLGAGIVISASLGVLCSVVEAPLAAFVLAMMGAPALVGLTCLTWTLLRDPDLRPSRSSVSPVEFRALRRSSVWFFQIDFASAVGYQTDVLVIASVLGARDAGVYSVCMRVFGLITASLSPALLQLWPAFADAYARGDAPWIRSRLRGSVLVGGLVGAAASLVLVLVGPTLISTWLTSTLEPPRTLMLACAIWTVCQLLNAPFFLLMNATNRVRVHARLAVGVACLNLPLSVWLAFAIGLPGPVLGSFLATLLVMAVPGTIATRRLFREPMFAAAAEGRTVDLGGRSL
jgi:O-antigen/teichoic acid export membrane protein